MRWTRRGFGRGLLSFPAVVGVGGSMPTVVGATDERTSVRQLVAELGRVADEMVDHAAVRADFEALTSARGLEPTEALLHDYARVKLAFEATRDGGWWQLRWRITHRKPNSEAIWAQWAKNPSPQEGEQLRATAEAECDELSALFAFLVRRLGVDKVGLFWPQWNHVVAVWTVPRGEVIHRIVVPTSQIFLSSEASLGTEEFNPWKQKTIYTYRRKDVSLRHRIPGPVATFFVEQAWAHAMRPQLEQQARRNARSALLDGS